MPKPPPTPDPLFVGDRDTTQRITVGALQAMLARVATVAGLSLNADRARYGHDTNRWPLEEHVDIELLADIPSR